MLKKEINYFWRKVFDVTKEDAEDMVNEGDKDKNGGLTEEEWIKTFVKKMVKKAGDKLWKIFKYSSSDEFHSKEE